MFLVSDAAKHAQSLKAADHRQMAQENRPCECSVGTSPCVQYHSSGLRQAECRLLSARRARLTFSRISKAFAVQMKGLGFWLCLSMYSPMAMISSSGS